MGWYNEFISIHCIDLEREWFYSFSRRNIISLFNQIPSARQSVMSLIVNEVSILIQYSFID